MRGCVLPRLPVGGESLDCEYVEDLKVSCSLTCRGEEGERISYCYLYQGEWRGQLTCRDLTDLAPLERLERLASCVHRRQTGCLVPARPASSQLQCGVRRTETWCRVRCGPGLVSPADWASCHQDSLLHYHWSSSNEARPSLVQRFLLAPAILCHKEPSLRPILGALERKRFFMA